jgi:hypothetical protein
MVHLIGKVAIRSLGGVVIIIAIAQLTGSPVPAASKHKDPSTCAVSMGSVINGQQRLLVTAWALTSNSSYLEAQTGVQSVMVTSDGAGSVSDQSLVYQGHGSYDISFDYYYWSNNKLVQATATSCSASL